MPEPLTLSDTQLMLLSAASQRDDLLITLPETLKGGAVKAVVAKLLRSGLVEELPVGRDSPHWHKDEEGQPIGLKLTGTGLHAIGVEPSDEPDAIRREKQEPPSTTSGEPLPEAIRGDAAGSLTAPRAGTKRALVVELLSREQGASLDELTAATSWLPHTIRAALTGLRQSRYLITRSRGDDNRVAYRITPAAGTAAAQHADATVEAEV